MTETFNSELEKYKVTQPVQQTGELGGDFNSQMEKYKAPSTQTGQFTPDVKKGEEMITNPAGLLFRNITSMPSSSWNFAKRAFDFLNPLQVAKRTFKTGENIGEAIWEFQELKEEAGGTKKALGYLGESLKEETPKAAYQMIPEATRQIIEGDLIRAANTIANDPVGQIYPYLALAKYGFDKAGKGEQFDEAIQNIASPITKPVGSLISNVREGIGNIGAQFLGKTTGKGPEAIRRAYEATEKFKEGISGKIGESELVKKGQQLLQKVKEKRRSEYQAKLKELEGGVVKGQDAALEQGFSSVKDVLQKKIEDYRIVVKNGKLDFSNSSIVEPSEMAAITKAWKFINGQTDFSAIGLDNLKQQLSGLWTANSKSNPFTESLKTATRDILNTNVKGYSEMTAGYSQTSALIKDIEQQLSLGGNKNIETAFKKLTGALKQDNNLRTDTIKLMEEATGQSLMDEIAGVSMRNLKPSGGTGALIGLQATFQIFGGFMSFDDFIRLAATSPRVVGEVVMALGISDTWTNRIIGEINSLSINPGIVGGTQINQPEE